VGEKRQDMVVVGVLEVLGILGILEQVFKDCVKMFLEKSLDIEEEDQDRKEGYKGNNHECDCVCDCAGKQSIAIIASHHRPASNGPPVVDYLSGSWACISSGTSDI